MPNDNVVKKGTAVQSHWDSEASKTKAQMGRLSGIRLWDYKRENLENKNKQEAVQAVIGGCRRSTACFVPELSCFVPELSCFVPTDELRCLVPAAELSCLVPAAELSCFLLLSCFVHVAELSCFLLLS
ncbi:hypothetical protein TNCV_4627401 [Trichonephila clavipes]|nr:hypothetical protein TNCV_4627401 [Trichonephila clavipes]